MNHSTVRKLTRAATLSLFVLTMASGVAGLQVLAASPAIADQAEVNQGGAVGDRVAEETPAPAPAENPVTKVVGGLLGGGV